MPRWTPEARAKQAAKIKAWRPWESSTGPTTPAGKAVCSKNAMQHGAYSSDVNELISRARAYAEVMGWKRLRKTTIHLRRSP